MKHKKMKREKRGDCLHCSCCFPLGEGDHFCDRILEMVMENYNPTEHFGRCIKKRRELCNGGNT